MKTFLSIIKNPWIVQGIGILAVGLLIWFVGPLLSIGQVIPLGSSLIRGIVIAVIVVVWIVVRLLLALRAAKKGQEFSAALAESAEDPSNEAVETEENIDALKDNFSQALELLKPGSGSGRSTAHLYELPWYIIIGPPGSGKSTALVNSGLKFPLAERFGKKPVTGLSGTRNCEWFFTDEAVLIDTAGRYVTQESHQAVDSAEWDGFLNLLKQYRPRRPINGAVVAISIADLLLNSPEERAAHAKAIRNRIQELYQKLGTEFPIYVLLTKCDLMAGFNEFFGDMDEERRSQVWGETFQNQPGVSPANLVQKFGDGFDELVSRLVSLTTDRIHAVRDLQRRSLILDFPQQVALLKHPLLDFLDKTFATSRYEIRPWLRGIYLTSGTQEGTPIDRVIGLMAGTLRINRPLTPHHAGRGKSFFITHLLRDVVFPEAELAGTDARIEKRKRIGLIAGYAGMALISIGAILCWLISYGQNTQAISETQQSLERFRNSTLDSNTLASNLRTVVPKLDALRDSAHAYENSGISAHFGLYQGQKLEQAGNNAYENWLKTAFLPLISRELADRISGPEGNNPEVLYELLRVYLMLGQPEHMDAGTARPWILSAWQRDFATEPGILTGLSRHLDHLLSMHLDPAPLDSDLVNMARNRLTQVRSGVQIYTRFRNLMQTDHAHDFNVAESLGPNAAEVFIATNGQDISKLSIPGLFTGWGYVNDYLEKGRAFVEGSTEDSWVLGESASQQPEDTEKLYRDLQNLYFADYQKAWKDLLATLRLRQPAHIDQTVAWLDILGDEKNSPLTKLLQAVKDNTRLSALSPLKAGNGPDAAPADNLDPQSKKALEQAAQTPAATNGQQQVQALEAAFKDQVSLLGNSPEQPGGLQETLKALGALRDSFVLKSKAAAGGEAVKQAAAAAPAGDPAQKAKAQLAKLPDPMKGWLSGLASTGANQSDSGMAGEAKKQLNALLKTEVSLPCKNAITGRYPLSPGSRSDIAVLDFSKMFATGGSMDQFFQTHLKPFVDVTRPDWIELSQDRKPLGLSTSTIRQFQYASRIRTAFFPTGGAAPLVSFQLKPLSLDAGAARVRLIIEGQEVMYEHGPDQVFSLQWPGPNAGSGVRLVFETPDGRQASKSFEGPWATFRLLDGASIQSAGMPELFTVQFKAESFSASFELRASSVNNPFGLAEMRAFTCPEGL